MQLRKTKTVGIFNNYYGRITYINTGLYDS